MTKTPRTKTILITGATAGIGRATALGLARAGHRVLATGRNPAVLDEVKREAPDGRVSTIVLDVTHRGQLADAVKQVAMLTNGDGIDVLINNAGFGVVAPTSEVSERDVRAQYETNVFGLLAVTQAFVPQMRARGSGTIINVSSVGGRLTLPFLGSYNSTKYAVESLSDALRNELRPFGIHVALVEPGLINTNFGSRSTKNVERFVGPGSHYTEALSNMDAMLETSEAMGVPPERIAKAIIGLVAARRPRARTVAPFSAQLALRLASVLPTAWLDVVLRRVGGLHRTQPQALVAAAR